MTKGLESKERLTVAVCDTCPWRLTTQGRQGVLPHGKKKPVGWYSVTNLKRLWNGMRTGKAPGMTCHSTDPRAVETGGAPVPERVEMRECAGYLILAIRHANELLDGLGKTPPNSPESREVWARYRSRHQLPFTLSGLRAFVVERVLNPFQPLPTVIDNHEVGLPWDSMKFEVSDEKRA